MAAPTLQERLDAARDAYEKLLLGEAVVEVRDADGTSIRYSPATASRLLSYINNLEGQLGSRPLGPMRPFFT